MNLTQMKTLIWAIKITFEFLIYPERTQGTVRDNLTEDDAGIISSLFKNNVYNRKLGYKV